MIAGKLSRNVLMGIVLLTLLLAMGCVRLLPPPDLNNPIAKVTVLPMTNSTNDADGPVWMRKAIAAMIPTRYYQVVSLDETDNILREQMNITLAGQLDYSNPGAGAPSPEAVGKALAVDGLFYCNLDTFQSLVTGFYNKRAVKAKCKLVNSKTSAVVWEKEEEESNSEMNLSVAGALQSVRDKVVGSLLNKALRVNPLGQEMNVVVDKMKQTIPSGPVGPVGAAK